MATAPGILSTAKDLFMSAANRLRIGPSPNAERAGMRWDDLPSRQVQRLMDAVRGNYKDMANHRRAANDIWKEAAGHMVQTKDSMNTIPLNKLQQMMLIFSRRLVSANPQCKIGTDYQNLRSFAFAFELRNNRHYQEIQLKRVLKRAVIEALPGTAIVKTGIAAGDELWEIEGQFYDPGTAFSANVGFSDFVIDMQARDPDRINFIGDRYPRPIEWIEGFRQRSEQGLGVALRSESEMRPEERYAGITEAEEKRIYNERYIWDIYLPKEQLMVVIPDGEKEPLAVFPWDGPDSGPYQMLGFFYPSESTLAVGPAQMMYELHCFANEMMRKQSQQASRQKNILVGEKGAEKGMEQIVSSNDGDALLLPATDLDRIRQMSLGGADPTNFTILLKTLEWFDLLPGNLNALAGLMPQSETARQDAMLQESSNALMDRMGEEVIAFTTEIMRNHGWYLWTDPLSRKMMTVSLPGFDHVRVPIEWTPEERKGSFLNYNFDFDPYSLRERTPEETFQVLMSFLNQWILPSAQMAQQAGWMPNFEGITRRLAELARIPFDQVYQPIDPSMSIPQQSGEVAPPPRLSHTVNERISRPGMSPQGNDKNLMQAMMGAKPQNETAGALPVMA